MKLMMVALLVLALTGCKKEVTSSPIEMVVIDAYQDTSALGCIGTNWNTILRSDTGKVSRLCHKYGDVGTRVSGCWVTTSSLEDAGGFTTNCPLGVGAVTTVHPLAWSQLTQ